MKLVAGNWKMNGLRSSMAELDALLAAPEPAGARLLLCPPVTLLAAFAERAAGSHVAIGAQDCHPRPSGAHTGDISAQMLVDAGATHVIIGHSERRADHAEDDAIVSAKASAALAAGLVVLLCVGESLAQREAGETLAVLRRQIDGSLPPEASPERLVISYEPVWAIGTGLTPTLEQVEEAHRAILDQVGPDYRLLYGGSVKPDNAAAILALPSVGGALVGGASLKARDFLAIATASPT